VAGIRPGRSFVAHSVLGGSQRIVFGGLIAAGGGVAASLLIAATARGGPYWADGLLLCTYLLAASAVAGLLGLVFAVPRARAEGTESGPGRFVSNSNLEQISDWLTKILVGAGLVQLGALPGGLRTLGDYLGTDLAIPSGQAASVALTVYGSGVGFVFAYLWGRLRLRVLLEASEKEAEEQARRQLVETSLAAASTGEPARRIAVAAENAATAVRSSAASLPPVLWVDDHPENNASERQALSVLGIPIHVATSTTEALRLLDRNRYGVIITDLGREEDGVSDADAGLKLTREVRARHPETPVVVYATRRALDRRRELEDAGASHVFVHATDLVEYVAAAITSSR